MNYDNMTNEEIKEQLEWSDSSEFSYGYSMWAFNEIKRLNNIIKEAREYIENAIETGNCTEDISYKNGTKKEHNYYVNSKDLLEILDKVEKENDIEFDVLKALNTDLDDDVEMG